MAVETLIALSDSDIVRNSNRVRELVIEDLVDCGLLTKEDADQYLGTRVLVGYRPSWFGKAWRKWQKKEDKDELCMTIKDISYQKKE